MTGNSSRFSSCTCQPVAPGIWRLRWGSPDRFVPTATRVAEPAEDQLAGLPAVNHPPLEPDTLDCQCLADGCLLRIPMISAGEAIHGFGLEARAWNQTGLCKRLALSAEPMGNTGAGHAPVPWYLSSAGYGVWLNTYRICEFHINRLRELPDLGQAELPPPHVDVFIPGTRGIELFLFAGPGMREVVQRYNLFSGGGVLPPLWGLGLKYRLHAQATQQDILSMASQLRQAKLPCDVLGLEPGWQSHSYSCSLEWNHSAFPDPDGMVAKLRAEGFHVNLWEHAFLHPTSPLFEVLKNHAGTHAVWGGLVPDLADEKVRARYGDYHRDAFLRKGIDGFKADECDHQPAWEADPFNFPVFAQFPSGIGATQLQQAYGYLIQKSLLEAFQAEDCRTWSDVRASSSLAAPLPFNLYSDAYAEKEYLLQLLNASLCGLLWSPEVRCAESERELLDRLALAVFAPQTCLNLWFMPNPLWTQPHVEANQCNQLLPPARQQRLLNRIRRLINLRMNLVPYLYSAFANYCRTGLPPVRALLLDFPDDPHASEVTDAFLFGSSLLIAPFCEQQVERPVYLPKKCDWYDFYTGERWAGGQTLSWKWSARRHPVILVRDNSLLPLARPVQQIAPNTLFELTVHIYGDRPEPFELFEDDGTSYAYQEGKANQVILRWQEGKRIIDRRRDYTPNRYHVSRWVKSGETKGPLKQSKTRGKSHRT